MPPIRGGQASPTSPPYPPRAVHSKQRSPSDVVSPSEHASANNKASDENGDSLASEGKGEVQKQQKAVGFTFSGLQHDLLLTVRDHLPPSLALRTVRPLSEIKGK